MSEQIAAFVLDEGRWLVMAMPLALLLASLPGRWIHRRSRAVQEHWQTRLHIFYGSVIGIMAGGHLLAVSIVASRGTLTASPLWVYALGLALAGPAWWLVISAFSSTDTPRRGLALNGWLAIALLALGLHDWPLALPAVLNIVHGRCASRPGIAATVRVVLSIFYLGLFAGALAFMASGQTFEEFMAP